MSLKKLLGLEGFPLSDVEIAAKLAEARKQRKSEVVFRSGEKEVIVGLAKTNPNGITRFVWQSWR